MTDRHREQARSHIGTRSTVGASLLAMRPYQPIEILLGNDLLGLAVIALTPLGQDLVAILRGPGKVVLDQTLLVIRGQFGLRLGNTRLREDREVLFVQLHRRRAGREVRQFLRRFFMGRALDYGGRFDLPAQAFFRQDDVQRRALAFQLDGRVFEGNTNREFAGSRQFARLGTGVNVLADVLVQAVHVRPTLLLAEGLQPGADIKETGAGRGRVRHDDLAFVLRLGQVLPAHGFAQALLFGFDSVEANGRGPDVHADPGWRVGGVAVVAADLGQILWRIALQHALLIEDRQA